MNGQIHVCRFFEQALLGRGISLDGGNVASIDRGAILKLRQRADSGAPCLRIPALPKFED